MSMFALWISAVVVNVGVAAYQLWLGMAVRRGSVPALFFPKQLRGARAVEFRRYSWRSWGSVGFFAVMAAICGTFARGNPFAFDDAFDRVSASIVLLLVSVALGVGWSIFCGIMASRAR